MSRGQGHRWLAAFLWLSLLAGAGFGADTGPATGIVLAPSGLTLREKPEAGAARIGRIADGATITVLRRDGPEATIEGRRSRWFQVTHEKRTGWVFGGFVQLSDDANAPTDQASSALHGFAAKLHGPILPAVEMLATEFERLAHGRPPEEVSALLHQFMIEYRTFMAKLDKAEVNSQNQGFPAEERLRRELPTVGWQLDYSEGMGFIREIGDWPMKRFGRLVPKAWQEYFAASAREAREGFSEDAALQVSWDVLRQRLEFWEDFANRHPDFPLKDDINHDYAVTFRAFLVGMDNTPITVSFEDRTVSKAVRKAWNEFIERNPNSRIVSWVQRHRQRLAKEGWIMTRTLEGELEPREPLPALY